MCTNAVSDLNCEAYFSNCLFIPRMKTYLNKKIFGQSILVFIVYHDVNDQLFSLY